MNNIPARSRRGGFGSRWIGCWLFLLALLGGSLQAQTSTEVTTIAGAFAGLVDGDNQVSQLDTPHGVAYDNQGNLYIADYGNDALRMLHVSSQTLVTLLPRAGQVNPLAGPVDVALDEYGNVYVANQKYGEIVRFTLDT